MSTLNVKLLLPEATVPTKGTPGAAGWDLYAAEDLVIPAGTWSSVETGIAVSMPAGHVGLIWPRSGLAARYGVDVLAGVVDSDYRGGVAVVLVNHGWEDFEVETGMRVAQLVVQREEASQLQVVSELGKTHRDVRGFGSTGHERES
jgi:dUTP pyrophosphatase